MLFGLREALAMLNEEGLEQVFGRHRLLASAARAAVRAWGLDIACERADECSPVVTTVLMPAFAKDTAGEPEGHDADRFRSIVLERFNMSLGAGLGRLKGRAFRIGHPGTSTIHVMARCAASRWGSRSRTPFARGGAHAALTRCAALGASHSPVNFGLRFARKAATPSRKSWLA
jgi:alanine-glyoxylate transaminase/serine-glyoxylate transaminase/serine-pyruvate transaminase